LELLLGESPDAATAVNTTTTDDILDRWLAAASERYLADLTMPELTRALRALSSCYVERRSQLASGQAFASAGKRAAFALFYAPLHFITVDRIARELLHGDDEPSEESRLSRITLDLGCGTGAGGAAWALATGAARVEGYDINPWAAREARWSYNAIGLKGSTHRVPIDQGPRQKGSGRHDCGVRPERACRRDARSRPAGAVPGRSRWTSSAGGRTDRQRRGPLVGRLAP
jgi:hypothetical protein